MDADSNNKKQSKEQVQEVEDNNVFDSQVYQKDQEIQRLKQQLKESKEVLKNKEGDIRATVNDNGDIAKICIGTNANGQRIFKEANKLTDTDIKRREEYINSIKVENQKRH